MKRSYPSMPPEFLERYLSLIGVQRRKPTVDALGELVRAHLLQIPFENISKLYYQKHLGLRGLISLGLFLDGIERFHFGGTCYANNYYFYQLLADLGYQIRLCGADMSNPDVHMVSMVTVEKRDYLVDVGYAAPFLEPLPRDLAIDYSIVLGRDRFVLKPRDAEGRSRLDLYRDGNLKHGYVAKPEPKQIRDFEQVIADSYRTDATFMNALLLTRFFPNRSIAIHNLTVVESAGAVSRIRTLNSRDELAQAIHEHFAIPADLVLDTVKAIGPLGDAWT